MHTRRALAIRAPRRLAQDSAEPAAEAGRPPLVIGCGALANELVELTRRAGLPPMDLTCLPASLHNRPERIAAAVARKIRRARSDGYDRIFVAYADCGTGGALDRVLEAEGVARLEGAHCYEVYAGRAAFAAFHDAEPGTFYLTDFLARNFQGLVIRGLGIDRHPELLPVYFGNYRRLVYLAQTDDAALTQQAEAAAARLGLTFERHLVGLGELAPAIASFASPSSAGHTPRPDLELVPEAGGPSSGVRLGRRSAMATSIEVTNLHPMIESDPPTVVGALRRAGSVHSRNDSSLVTAGHVRNARSMKIGVGKRHQKDVRDARAGVSTGDRARFASTSEAPA